MKAKLIVEGKEFDIDIFDSELQKLVAPKKQTGYENVGKGHVYSYVDHYGVIRSIDHDDFDDDTRYAIGNYYSHYEVARNNARADKLMRQLRRYAVEHRDENLDWGNNHQWKYSIYFNYSEDTLQTSYNDCYRDLFNIYFPSEECAKAAIETFHDELIWYFTEYKDSL